MVGWHSRPLSQQNTDLCRLEGLLWCHRLQVNIVGLGHVAVTIWRWIEWISRPVLHHELCLALHSNNITFQKLNPNFQALENTAKFCQPNNTFMHCSGNSFYQHTCSPEGLNKYLNNTIKEYNIKVLVKESNKTI